jgi:hypothetical protein
MSPCCGCPSLARTGCVSRCCSPSPAAWRFPSPTRWPGVITSVSGTCGRSRSSRSRRNRLVTRLAAGRRRAGGPHCPYRSCCRQWPARRLADGDRQRLRHRPGPRVRRPLLRAPRDHVSAGHRCQSQPGRRRLVADRRFQLRHPGLRPLLPGRNAATSCRPDVLLGQRSRVRPRWPWGGKHRSRFCAGGEPEPEGATELGRDARYQAMSSRLESWRMMPGRAR